MITIGVNGEGVNENDLVTSRSCIIAQSGAGKSYGVAVICEQLASMNLGFCIIDTEGEYFSLKQKFDVLWVGGKESDVNFSSIDLDKLALMVVKESIPVIIDVSDLSDEKEAVNRWITALYDAATKLRNPYLLIIEEADKFVPQRGVKMPIIHEVARRGRKRGLGLLVASQRPALVDKEVLSQCNRQFIGKLTVENDLDAVRHFFNSRKDLYSLPDLLPGEFFMFGFKPEGLLFKFKPRVTKHTSITPDVKVQLPARIKEVINKLSSIGGLGVKALISKSDAEKIAFSTSRKQYLLFGERERVESNRLVYKPLIELSLRVLRKKLFGEEFVDLTAYLTPELYVVDEGFKSKFDLSFMKGLSGIEVKALISLLYSGVRTVSGLMSEAALSEKESRKVLKGLVSKELIIHSGWSGKQKVFKVNGGIKLPRVLSLASDIIETDVTINEDFSPDNDLIKRVIQSLDYKADIVGSKVIYYPFYKVVLKRGSVSRELFVNAVTGRIE